MPALLALALWVASSGFGDVAAGVGRVKLGHPWIALDSFPEKASEGCRVHKEGRAGVDALFGFRGCVVAIFVFMLSSIFMIFIVVVLVVVLVVVAVVVVVAFFDVLVLCGLALYFF